VWAAGGRPAGWKPTLLSGRRRRGATWTGLGAYPTTGCGGGYAARGGSARRIHFAISVVVAPAANRARTRRSSETEASADSILATRDWLDPSRAASAVWVRPQRSRASRRAADKENFSSTKRDCSGLSCRNSEASLTTHPAFCRRSTPARIEDLRWRGLCFLGERLKNNNADVGYVFTWALATPEVSLRAGGPPRCWGEG